MKLPARVHDDLQWEIEGNPEVFEFDLGLHEPFFPLEDELHFQALTQGLNHFSTQVWPRFPSAAGILYRGSLDFSQFFKWTEAQEANFAIWKEDRASHSLVHLKRLFCAESFVTYFQMLAHRLPDEMPLTLMLDPVNTGSLAEMLHLLSPERFEHFQIDAGLRFDSTVGICFPPDDLCSDEILGKINELIKRLSSFRPVYEPLLTEQWDGLDEIYVFEQALSSQGKRKLKGFEAAGGKIISAQ